MKRISYFQPISLVLAWFLIVGCGDVTDQVNPSGITAANFYKSAFDADNAINACYDAFQNPYRYVIWGDGRADILASTDRSDNNQLQIVNGNVDANNTETTWTDMYNAIKRTNSVLKNVPGIQDAALASRKERILGEAYYLRALAYFYLVRTYDNVPLIAQPYESLSQDFYPVQATSTQVFSLVKADLDSAAKRLTDLPFSTTLENKGKATLGSVNATLADYYLWQKKYQEAADAALKVINGGGGYRLVAGDSYGTIFTAKNTVESIFEIQFNNAFLEKSDNGAKNTNSLVSQFLPLGGTGYTGGNWSFKPAPKLINAFSSGDKRISITFQNTGTSPAPYRDVNVSYTNKYQGTLANGNATRNSDNNMIIYRLADVILMRAEALNELGQLADAILLLNQIRVRAGLTNTTATTQADVRLAIEDERYRELAFEGKRYYDLKRTGRYAAVTGNTEPNWLRWPLNSVDLIYNPNLKQNSGY